MQSNDQTEIAQGLKMTAVAVVSAIITATLVIGAGNAWVSRHAQDTDQPSVPLIRTAH